MKEPDFDDRFHRLEKQLEAVAKQIDVLARTTEREFRELVIPKTPFVVPYRVTNTTLQILRIYHQSRRWPKQL
jgi:plasmid stabilization system protein ParE